MVLSDRLKGRMAVECSESEGLESALRILDKFKQRTFKVRGRGIRAFHVPHVEVARFIQEELPGYYTYTIRGATFLNRRQVRHTCIEIKGWIGLSQQMNRYNPLDLTCTVRTEALASA